jgi:hypothetical protein
MGGIFTFILYMEVNNSLHTCSSLNDFVDFKIDELYFVAMISFQKQHSIRLEKIL